MSLINNIIGKVFGNKSDRDMKEIMTFVNQIKAVYPSVERLTNDELRAMNQQLRQQISDSIAEETEAIHRLKEESENAIFVIVS